MSLRAYLLTRLSAVFAAILFGMANVPSAVAADGTATLSITVTNVAEAVGDVHYALYDKAESFPKRDGRLRKGKVKATARETVIRIDGLKPGTYAVAVFHDENGNDEFDQGIFGIPLEDYGFSNDASGFLSAPDFADAKFTVGPEGAKIRLTLRR